MTKPVPARYLLSAVLVFGCDPGSEHAPPATGGSVNATGGVTANGGAATGGVRATGGAGASSGGTAASGGGRGGSSGSGAGGVAASGGTAPGGAANGGAPASGAGGASAGAGACTGALFCDDFEKATAGQPPGGVWTPRTSAGSVSVDESKVFSGTKSIKFMTEAMDGTKTAFLRLKSDSVFPIAGNHFFGRMMIWLDAAPTTSVHWTLLQATGLVPGQTYRAQYRYGGQHPIMENGTFKGSQWMGNYETPDSYAGMGPSTDCWHHGNGTVIPVGKWSCVEWEFDGPNASMRLWLDGTALEDLTVVGKGQGCVGQDAAYPWTAPDFTELEIGWESYQNDAARSLYIDDVVVSTKPIGCPK